MHRKLTLAGASAEALFRSNTGHGSPRKSKITDGMQSGEPDSIYWLKRRNLKDALRKAAQSKRIRALNLARGIRSATAFVKRREDMPCFRRVAEFFGLPSKQYNYTVKPRLLRTKQPKIVYELSLAFEPLCSFTDAFEAAISCKSLHAQGYMTAQITQRDRSQS